MVYFYPYTSPSDLETLVIYGDIVLSGVISLSRFRDFESYQSFEFSLQNEILPQGCHLEVGQLGVGCWGI